MASIREKAARFAVLPSAYPVSNYTKADIYALQALRTGTASEEQQKRALDWIINAACGFYENPYRPGDTHDTAHACGRRFVADQIRKLLALNPSAFE